VLVYDEAVMWSKNSTVCLAVCTQYRIVTDRQTDGHLATDIHLGYTKAKHLPDRNHFWIWRYRAQVQKFQITVTPKSTVRGL